MPTLPKYLALCCLPLIGFATGCAQQDTPATTTTTTTTTTTKTTEQEVASGVRTASRVVVRQVASTPVKVITTVGHAAEVVKDKITDTPPAEDATQ